MAATVFHFRALDGSGRRLKGVEAAASPEALADALQARGLLLLDAEAPDDASARRPPASHRRARQAEVLELARALAALLPAGVPLARALDVAAGLATGTVALAITTVRERVERGEALASALAESAALFPPLSLGLVRAGERSGDLAGAFRRLAAQLEQEEALRGKLVSAAVYPLVLAVAGGLAVVILLFFVLPRFVELLEGSGAALPRSTAALLALSGGLQSHWPLLLALAAAGVLSLAWARTTEEGARARATLLLRLPGVGTLRRQALAARFARLVGVLLGGGAPLLGALDDTIECLADAAAREEAVRIRTRVREGAALHAAIAEGSLFPPLMAQLVAVGEASGRLQEFLLKTAEILEERTQRAVERLVALAEPAMIVVFGGIVGFVALSVLQAIYGINAGSFR
ncbi:MAG TPA: type II secretion system F family protein [Gemmatimonadales bacterium]